MHVTGEPDGPPISVGLPICDLGTGMWRCRASSPPPTNASGPAWGALSNARLETAVGFSSWTSAQWLGDHEEPTRQGSRHRQNAPYQRMRTRDYLMTAPPADRSGSAAPRLWGTRSGATTAFCGNEQRMQNRAALEAEIEAVLTTATSDHGWRCQSGFPNCTAVLTLPNLPFKGRAAPHPRWGRVGVGVMRAKPTNGIGGAATRSKPCWRQLAPCGPVYNYAQMSPTRRCATAARVRERSSSAKCRTSAPRSRSARVYGCAPSPLSSASTMPRSSAGSR